ncbi:MAG: hypothetical protein K2X35_08790 [Bryobacteraceae bacterium]|nr:hypothetical protein [Bryobacteraceae bacterium]
MVTRWTEAAGELFLERAPAPGAKAMLVFALLLGVPALFLLGLLASATTTWTLELRRDPAGISASLRQDKWLGMARRQWHVAGVRSAEISESTLTLTSGSAVLTLPYPRHARYAVPQDQMEMRFFFQDRRRAQLTLDHPNLADVGGMSIALCIDLAGCLALITMALWRERWRACPGRWTRRRGWLGWPFRAEAKPPVSLRVEPCRDWTRGGWNQRRIAARFADGQEWKMRVPPDRAGELRSILERFAS